MKRTSTSIPATAFALLAAIVTTSAAPSPGAAADWAVRATLEPGVGSLTPAKAAGADWGGVLGLSVAMRAGDLLWIAAAGAWSELPDAAAYPRVRSVAALVHYPLDIGEIEPFFEFGAAFVNTSNRSEAAIREVVPVLGLGIDLSLLPWLQVGAAVRYEPILDSDLFSAAYMGWHSRITLCTQAL